MLDIAQEETGQESINVCVMLIVIVPHWYEVRLLRLFPLNRERGDFHYRTVKMAGGCSVQFYVNHWTYDFAQVKMLQRIGTELRKSGYADTYRVSFTLMPRLKEGQ